MARKYWSSNKPNIVPTNTANYAVFVGTVLIIHDDG